MDMIFDKTKLLSLFLKIDKQLKRPAKIYVIGGSAACLAYDAKLGTKDIDAWSIENEVIAAYEKVIKNNPQLKISFGKVDVQIKSPYMKNRFFERSFDGIHSLKLYFPEPEDLFLMKAQRADHKDIDDVKNLSKVVFLDSGKILNRFKMELLPLYAGDEQLLISNYLVCVENVFGEDVADLHQKRISR